MGGNIESATADALGYVMSASVDVFFLAGLFLLLLAYGLKTSKGHLTSLILAIYAALLLVPTFSYKEFVTVAERAVFDKFDMMSLVTYSVVVLIAFVVMRRVVDCEWEVTKLQGLYQTGLLAFVTTTLFTLGAFRTSLVDGFQAVTSVDTLFTTPEYTVWWIFASLVAILITSR